MVQKSFPWKWAKDDISKLSIETSANAQGFFELWHNLYLKQMTFHFLLFLKKAFVVCSLWVWPSKPTMERMFLFRWRILLLLRSHNSTCNWQKLMKRSMEWTNEKNYSSYKSNLEKYFQSSFQFISLCFIWRCMTWG